MGCALMLQLLSKVTAASSKLPENLECICILLGVIDGLADQFGCITYMLESFTSHVLIQ